MRIALHKTGNRMQRGARPERRQSGKAGFGQARDHLRVDAIPRRDQHRPEARAEAALEAGATRGELGDRPAPPAAACPAPSCARPAARDCGARSRAGRPSRIALAPRRRRGSAPSSAGMTASATGTSACCAISSSRSSAGESRHASSSRHQRSARRPGPPGVQLRVEASPGAYAHSRRCARPLSEEPLVRTRSASRSSGPALARR